jgi:hypothetical protein
VDPGLTISTATDQFCESVSLLAWRTVLVRPELFFGVLDVLGVRAHHVLGQRNGTGVPLGIVGVRVAPGV